MGFVEESCNEGGRSRRQPTRWLSNFVKVSFVMHRDRKSFESGARSRVTWTEARSRVAGAGTAAADVSNVPRSSSSTSGYSVSHSSSLMSIGLPSSVANSLAAGKYVSMSILDEDSPVPYVERVPYSFSHLPLYAGPLASLYVQT